MVGDLTSVFDFKNPNRSKVDLPSTDDFLPSVFELGGGNVNTFVPTQSEVIIGVPGQEKGVRPARALPYEMDVQASVDASSSTVTLTFFSTGTGTVAFHVRSGNPADAVRFYTVEPGKQLSDTWTVAATYNLSAYGPNGFVRYFKGSVDGAALEVRSGYGRQDRGSITVTITNVSSNLAEVNVLDAYTQIEDWGSPA